MTKRQIKKLAMLYPDTVMRHLVQEGAEQNKECKERRERRLESIRKMFHLNKK